MIEYFAARICPNGHVNNAQASEKPDENQEYCERCGERNLMACCVCSGTIRGMPKRVMASGYRIPAYCGTCGSPFPWTERKIAAAIDLASQELSAEDAEEFITSVNEIARDTPQAQVGATRIQRLLLKAAPAAGQVIRDLVVDIASETAKKIILGGK